MREVTIIGAGSTQFGRAQWSLLKMMCEASHDAITDAGIGDRLVDAVVVANMGAARFYARHGFAPMRSFTMYGRTMTLFARTT